VSHLEIMAEFVCERDPRWEVCVELIDSNALIVIAHACSSQADSTVPKATAREEVYGGSIINRGSRGSIEKRLPFLHKSIG
jgi:hypothetical protein